ncbi:MAG: SCO family protein [Rhodospirillales bacterium]|nr:SCO family protein [Rhodospirillales bacterium]
MPRFIRIVLIICGILAFAATCVGVFLISDRYASKMAVDLVRSATLNDLHGDSWTVERLNRKIGIIYFGYTHCPDACPTALNSLAIALKDMGAERRYFQPIFVAIDPERDTPIILTDFISNFDKNILILSGSAAKFRKFAWVFGATFTLRKFESTDGDYVVDHTTNFILALADGTRVPLPVKVDPGELRDLLLRSRDRLLKTTGGQQ